MIVCICRAKSEHDVLRAIEDGAESISELQACGIGTECGSCHNFLRKMLAEQRSLFGDNGPIISRHARQQEDHRPAQ
ncbi:MAG TPA: (2Fe-2S)-binding protein [Thermoanaerobaculia bacterium]|nr:(2Fe-2S)-binding protein [Thermoanaerobaculia bacterium]